MQTPFHPLHGCLTPNSYRLAPRWAAKFLPPPGSLTDMFIRILVGGDIVSHSEIILKLRFESNELLRLLADIPAASWIDQQHKSARVGRIEIQHALR